MLTDRAAMSTILIDGSSLNVSYQLAVYLAKRFQRRIIFKKLTNQKQKMPVAAMFVNGSVPNVQFLYATFHRCFLQNVGSFFHAVLKEKI